MWCKWAISSLWDFFGSYYIGFFLKLVLILDYYVDANSRIVDLTFWICKYCRGNALRFTRKYSDMQWKIFYVWTHDFADPTYLRSPLDHSCFACAIVLYNGFMLLIQLYQAGFTISMLHLYPKKNVDKLPFIVLFLIIYNVNL